MTWLIRILLRNCHRARIYSRVYWVEFETFGGFTSDLTALAYYKDTYFARYIEWF